MKLPNFRRLNKNDYSEDEQTLVDKLSNSLNYGIEVLYTALNNRVNLRNNVDGTLKDIEITTDSNGIPLSSTTFVLNRQEDQPIGLIVIDNENLTNSSIYPAGGITLSWVKVNNTIQITHATGLQANNTYRLRVFAFNT